MRLPAPCFPEGIFVIGLAVLLIAAPIAGGTHLAPDPDPPSPIEGASVASARGFPELPASSPAAPMVVGGGGAVLAAGAALSTRRRMSASSGSPSAALGLEPPSDALVVFVPGHGNGPEVFDGLIDNMGLGDDQVRYFDYRLATEDTDIGDASERAPIDDTADALNGYLAGLAESGRPIYLVGFSKGGAAAAELISRWDDGGYGARSSVRGAMLLDPPLADGTHGWLQSLGRFVDLVPDDGGYNPVDCAFLNLFCDDHREHLGRDAGVDTVVIRNPASPLTSFNDVPDGLRVYDAADGGPSVWSLWSRPWEIPGRLTDAHMSVLDNPGVADCIVAEMNTPGTCALPPASPSAVVEAASHGLGPLAKFRPPWPF